MTPETDGSRPARGRIAVVLLVLVLGMGAIAYWLSIPSTTRLLADARAAIEAGRVQLAIDKARQVVARDPQSVNGWSVLARAGILAHDRTVWETAIDHVETIRPREALELWVTAGGDEMQRFHAANAETALRRAVAITRDQPEPWRLLAQLISVQGRPRETADCLLELIRLGDFSIGDLYMLGWPNSAVNEPHRVESLLAADPDNLIPMLGLVGSAMNENRTADAEQLLQRILRQHPQNSRAIALLGRLLAERDAPEFPAWQREQSRHAEIEPETWLARGIWLRRHGQVAAAVKLLHHAVELDPRHVNAVSELGHTLQTFGEPPLAAVYLDWARLQQEITELAKRIDERGESENTLKIIDRLEQVGRLWEAWGWCRAYGHANPNDTAAAAKQRHLEQQLAAGLPRTVPGMVPGRDFRWSGLAEPDWSPASLGPANTASDTAMGALRFVDEARSLGIDFHFENGPTPGGTIVQTSGGGVAALDYDLDGWCDLYFTQGGHDPTAAVQNVVDAFYRNDAGQGFHQVTAASGLVEDRFSQGVATGDFDNDGFPDLYVANLGLNRLLRNNGDGTFSDVTAAAELTATGWTTSTAIADLNGDGEPELFSVRYAGGPDIATRVCRDASGQPGVCRPTLFPAETDLVAVSSGNGTFVELCGEAGLDLPDGRGFGLIVGHFNEDNRLDVFVANDQTANFLLIQTGKDGEPMQFLDQAVVQGVAFDRDGYPQACMGIAAADINNDGRPDLFITNFAEESDTLYVSQPLGSYLDVTREAKLRDPSFVPLGFGTQFLDADLDGRFDLVVLNGHILDAPQIGKPAAMRPQLFRGMDRERFAEVAANDPGNFFNIPRIGRGLCTLDWNRDGQQDFAGSFLDGSGALVTNRSSTAGDWLVMEFVGVQSSRDAIGTRVRITLEDGTVRLWQLTAGDGFAASNQRRMQLGLGSHARIASLEIHWPSGLTQKFAETSTKTHWLAVEGRPHLLKMNSPHPVQE